MPFKRLKQMAKFWEIQFKWIGNLRAQNNELIVPGEI